MESSSSSPSLGQIPPRKTGERLEAQVPGPPEPEAVQAVLIDDNPDDRALVIRELRREFPNLQTVEISDAQKLERVLSLPPCDLVITDFQLHWSDGLETLRHVKTRWPDCPVIMFTGTGSEEVAVQAMKSGLDDYVLKSPKHYARLSAAAKLVLKMGRQKRRLRQAEARYSNLFDSVPMGLYRATPQGLLLDVNPAMIEMLQYSDQKSLLAVSLGDLFVTRDDYHKWLTLLQQQGVVYDFEVAIKTGRNGLCWTQNRARVITEGAHRAQIYEGSLEDITGRKKADDERENLIRELQEALATVKALSGLLPICASCKKIRDEGGAWNPLESFIQSHSDAEFTHSFCPECMQQLYPEIFEPKDKPE